MPAGVRIPVDDLEDATSVLRGLLDGVQASEFDGDEIKAKLDMTRDALDRFERRTRDAFPGY